MRTKQSWTAHSGLLPCRFAAALIAVGCALAYAAKPAVTQAAEHPSVLSNQLAGGCAILGVAGYSWVVLVVVVSLGEHLGGRLGQLSRGCARVVAPVAWRHSVRLACGAAAVVVPVVGLVAPQASAGSDASSPHGHANVSNVTGSHKHSAIRLDGLPMPERPTGDAIDPHVTPRQVVVRQGDTLWQIAARQLGLGAGEAEVAAEWPRWYAANRFVIGDDPGLIIPGTVLQAPKDVSRGVG
jgi:nucleoid-associated protein YgaU